MKKIESKVVVEGTPALHETIAQASKYQTETSDYFKQDQLVKDVVTNSLDTQTYIETL